MKVFYAHFNVGSGIEYVGDVFLSWIEEINGIDIFIQKEQEHSETIYSKIKEFMPDVIITNESYEKIRIPACKFKKEYPKTKIIYMCHAWINLTSNEIPNEYQEFIRQCDKIFCLNYIPKDKLEKLSNIENYVHPINPNEYKIIIPWNKREKMFVYLGNILPHKFSKEFIELLSKSNIKIDCYGRRDFPTDDVSVEYYQLFENCKNITYKGLVNQKDVASILNTYKYFVMPHDGQEPFNISLLQAIFCGTIPLISNDLNSKKYNPNWLHWAEGLYYSCNTAVELVTNLELISKEDKEETSNGISSFSMAKFNYEEFKKVFSDYLSGLKNNKLKIKWNKIPITTIQEKELRSNVNFYDEEKKNDEVKEKKNDAGDIWYGCNDIASCLDDNVLYMGKEQYLNPKVGPCGNIRSDSIYLIGNQIDLSDFKNRSLEIIKSFDLEMINRYSEYSDIYSLEYYQADNKNTEIRGDGRSILKFYFDLDNNEWYFYELDILKFKATTVDDVIQAFKEF